MSGTRRTPLVRHNKGVQITPRAVDLFEAMSKLKCSCPVPKPPTVGPCPGCERWYDLHADLHEELQLAPWQWPCVARQPKRAGSPYMNDEIAARMAALEAAKSRRTDSSKSTGNAVSDSSKEGPSNAEPVAGPGTSA